MNSTKNNIAKNLKELRSRHKLSQEEVAEEIGVSRQAVAKWENGDTLPDIINCEALADFYNVSLNDLVKYDEDAEKLPINPKNKHIFGTVTIGERGQIVLPKKARDIFGLKHGDILVVLGDTDPKTSGIALITDDNFLMMTGHKIKNIFNNDEEM